MTTNVPWPTAAGDAQPSAGTVSSQRRAFGDARARLENAVKQNANTGKPSDSNLPTKEKMTTNILTTFVLLAIVFGTGCRRFEEEKIVAQAEPFVPSNLYPIERLPEYFNRVVVLPCYHADTYSPLLASPPNHFFITPFDVLFRIGFEYRHKNDGRNSNGQHRQRLAPAAQGCHHRCRCGGPDGGPTICAPGHRTGSPRKGCCSRRSLELARKCPRPTNVPRA